MARKNNKKKQKKRHLELVQREKEKEEKRIKKIEEVQERVRLGINSEDENQNEDVGMKGEGMFKRIKKRKFKMFQKRVINNEKQRRKRLRKAPKLAYKKDTSLMVEED